MEKEKERYAVVFQGGKMHTLISKVCVIICEHFSETGSNMHGLNKKYMRREKCLQFDATTFRLTLKFGLNSESGGHGDTCFSIL